MDSALNSLTFGLLGRNPDDTSANLGTAMNMAASCFAAMKIANRFSPDFARMTFGIKDSQSRYDMFVHRGNHVLGNRTNLTVRVSGRLQAMRVAAYYHGLGYKVNVNGKPYEPPKPVPTKTEDKPKKEESSSGAGQAGASAA